MSGETRDLLTSLLHFERSLSCGVPPLASRRAMLTTPTAHSITGVKINARQE